MHPDRRGRLLLRGHGPQGRDQASRRATRSRTAATTRRASTRLLKGRRLTKPLIAAVEGPAIAGGTEILQGTDIRMAGESAKFGISEAKWSLYPMGGSAVRLVRQIPYTIACDLLLTGRHITAAEALEYGPDRLRRAGWHRAGQGAGDRRGDQQQRPARGAGDPADDPRDRGHARERRVQDRHARSASRCSSATTPRKARWRSRRSGRPTSR